MSRGKNRNHPIALKDLHTRDNGLCWICMILGKSQKDAFVEMKDASRDHIVPFSEGGHNSPSNIRLAHKECNGLRGVRSVMELKRDGL